MLKKLLLSTMATISFSAYAENFYCEGNINRVEISAPGYLYITLSSTSPDRGSFSHHRICNVKKDVKDVPADICKLVYTQALTSLTTQKTAQVYFRNESTNQSLG